MLLPVLARLMCAHIDMACMVMDKVKSAKSSPPLQINKEIAELDKSAKVAEKNAL